MKRTPLYDVHCRLNGKIIDFGGWELPVQYQGILEEHKKVRENAGLFDVSHMGEITAKGPDAEKFIQKLITNDLSKISDGQVMYSPMCYQDGGVVDDLLVYKFNADDYLIVVNASNTEKDFDWIKQQKGENVDVQIQNVSSEYAQIALQGPKAEKILQKLTNEPLSEIRFFRFKSEVQLCGVEALVSRTGYTGEDGFEIYISSINAELLWERIMEAGKEDGLVPVGLGARDTLRFEACLPLYGQEISPDITPLEAGLGHFVKLNKDDFIGKDALVRQKEKGLERKLAGIEMIDRGIPRSHYEIQVNGSPAGFVTTGSFAPSLNKNMGLALLESQYCIPGSEVDVIIRNKALKAKIVETPLYSKRYKK